MIWGAERFPAFSAWLAAAIAVTVASVTLIFVREPFAAAFGLAFAAALLVVAWRGGWRVSRWVLTTLGLVSCLYAVLDIKSDILDRPEPALGRAHARRTHGGADDGLGRRVDRGRPPVLLFPLPLGLAARVVPGAGRVQWSSGPGSRPSHCSGS